MPLRSKSATASEAGLAATVTGEPASGTKPLFAALRSRTETELAAPLLTARSGRPLPSKSAAAIPTGLAPAATDPSAVKLPPPVPSRIVTFALALLATARSSWPSPSKSATAICRGLPPVA